MSPTDSKFELWNKFDDLFETDESREDKNREKLLDIPISQIDDFPNHPYQVKDDENMTELVESIKTYGLLQPVLVRPVDKGRYQMISGHRRKRAFELAGIEKIPCRVKELTLDEAILMMVDSNLQRDEILPSEKAHAYKMRLDAMRRMPGRPAKENASPVATNLSKGRSDEELASIVGEGKDTIRRYIRLTDLIPEMLELVDQRKIALRPAVEISYLPDQAQYYLLDAIEANQATPSHAQTIKMRKYSNEGKLNQDVIDSIMEEEKPNQREKPLFRDKRIIGLIPKGLPPDKQNEYVVKALECYKKILEKKRQQSR